jgi:hypothetical protein
MNRIFILIFCLICIYSCADKPNFTDAPQIEFDSFSKNIMNQGSLNNDTTFLFLNFSDGDGDIGFGLGNSNTNVFITDNRTGEKYAPFRIPTIPVEGANNGVNGKIRLMLFTTCCIFPDEIPPCEVVEDYPTNELTLDIYIVDRAGNQSNTITTQPITLLCN